MKECGLTDKELKDFNEIVSKTINELVMCADKHNIDRDSFIKYFAGIFGAMAEITTFSKYKSIKKEMGVEL